MVRISSIVSAMLSDKNYGVMVIEALLLCNGSFRMQEVLSWMDVAEITYKRYLRGVREFLKAVDPDFRLVYFRKRNIYQLKNKKCPNDKPTKLARRLLAEIGAMNLEKKKEARLKR